MGLLSISVTFSAVVAGLIFVLWTNYYRRLFCDQYRQHLFRIRDSLFNRAAAGEISFEDPAYHSLRYMLNGMIRYAHKMSATTVFFMWLFRERLHVEDVSDPKLKEASEQYPEIFREIVVSSAARTVEYCLNCSLLLRLVFKIFRTLVERRHLMEKVARGIEPMVDDIGVVGAKRAGIAY